MNKNYPTYRTCPSQKMEPELSSTAHYPPWEKIIRMAIYPLSSEEWIGHANVGTYTATKKNWWEPRWIQPISICIESDYATLRGRIYKGQEYRIYYELSDDDPREIELFALQSTFPGNFQRIRFGTSDLLARE